MDGAATGGGAAGLVVGSGPARVCLSVCLSAATPPDTSLRPASERCRRGGRHRSGSDQVSAPHPADSGRTLDRSRRDPSCGCGPADPPNSPASELPPPPGQAASTRRRPAVHRARKTHLPAVNDAFCSAPGRRGCNLSAAVWVIRRLCTGAVCAVRRRPFFRGMFLATLQLARNSLVSLASFPEAEDDMTHMGSVCGELVLDLPAGVGWEAVRRVGPT